MAKPTQEFQRGYRAAQLDLEEMDREPIENLVRALVANDKLEVKRLLNRMLKEKNSNMIVTRLPW